MRTTVIIVLIAAVLIIDAAVYDSRFANLVETQIRRIGTWR